MKTTHIILILAAAIAAGIASTKLSTAHFGGSHFGFSHPWANDAHFGGGHDSLGNHFGHGHHYDVLSDDKGGAWQMRDGQIRHCSRREDNNTHYCTDWN